jgi:general stress protein YciG
MTDSKTQHRGGAGNFAEDRERAAEAGHKGGEQIRLAYANFVKRGLGRLVSAPRLALIFSPLRRCDGTCHRSSRFSQYQHLQGGNNGSYCWTRSHGPRDRPLNR